jgi:hypothetical protein
MPRSARPRSAPRFRPDTGTLPRLRTEESEERANANRLAELCARVKAARSVVATTPGLAETLARGRRRAAQFYAQFGISETMLLRGATAMQDAEVDGVVQIWSPPDGINEPWGRVSATLPEPVVGRKVSAAGKVPRSDSLKARVSTLHVNT